jgi:hypothetical protein
MTTDNVKVRPGTDGSVKLFIGGRFTTDGRGVVAHLDEAEALRLAAQLLRAVGRQGAQKVETAFGPLVDLANRLNKLGGG